MYELQPELSHVTPPTMIAFTNATKSNRQTLTSYKNIVDNAKNYQFEWQIIEAIANRRVQERYDRIKKSYRPSRYQRARQRDEKARERLKPKQSFIEMWLSVAFL